MSNQIHRAGRVLFIALLCGGALLLSSCHKSKPPITKRYPFTGRVVSINGRDQSAVIDGDAVPGFMGAMAMSYKIKPAAQLNQLAPGDSISAEVVVIEHEDASDYWLENVKVTTHAKSPPTAALHMPRGER
jgi:protein SCO1